MVKAIWRSAAVGLLALVSALTLGASASQAQSTWEKIHSSNKLRMGVTQAPPWFSKNPTTGEWDSGIMVSLGHELAKDLGVQLEMVEVTWATAIPALEANKIDFMGPLDATPARAIAVDFPVEPLLYISLGLLAREDLETKTWEDLNKPEVKIAVPQGTSNDAFLTRTVPKAQIQRYPDNGAAIAAFQSHRADAVSLFHPVLLVARKNLGFGKIVIPSPALSTPSSIALRREPDKTFRDWLGHAISYYYESGETQRWYEVFLDAFGLDPKASPVIQRELMYGK
jgi:polar amino acid transport system substrate-binding protein